MSKKDLLDKAKTVKFPYGSMEAAIKDAFKRVGGFDKAISLMAKGYKASIWRKRHDVSVKEAEAAVK